jgi:hypothetical protein
MFSLKIPELSWGEKPRPSTDLSRLVKNVIRRIEETTFGNTEVEGRQNSRCPWVHSNEYFPFFLWLIDEYENIL